MKKVFVQLESGRGYGRDILKGIHEYNVQFSKWEIIFEPAYYLKTSPTKDLVKLIETMEADGCILENMSKEITKAELGIPVIETGWIGHPNNNPHLKGNYDADGKMAVDYFFSHGFRNLGFFGSRNLAWSDGRFNSFKYHSELKGITVFNFMTKIKSKQKAGYDFDKIIIWLKSLPKPIGILCCNDDFGKILVNACAVGGLKIPYEIAVLGIDNDELLCNIIHPNLSSIARNHAKAAFNACTVLERMMNGEVIKDIYIRTEPLNIVERTSTNTIVCNDSEVIKALEYIRNNISLSITVEKVVESTNISRRSLYTRFKKVTGNTIYEEIQFHKLNKFKELLINQHLSVKEIAFRLGFDDVSHVSRWFSKIEGIPPLKWRDKYT